MSGVLALQKGNMEERMAVSGDIFPGSDGIAIGCLLAPVASGLPSELRSGQKAGKSS